jgi:hypothetical protein
MTAHLTKAFVQGFKKCCLPIAVGETDDSCGMTLRRMGVLGVSVKLETVTLIGSGR